MEGEEFIIIEVTPEVTDALSESAFGQTKHVAQEHGVCVRCKQPPTFYSDAGRREYRISGLCEPCFDELFEE